MDDVVGDERAAHARDQYKCRQRRQLESGGDEREHGEPGYQPAGADPTRPLGRRPADEMDDAYAEGDVG